MPAHARRGHPIKAGARTCQEPGGAARRDPARHVRVPAPRHRSARAAPSTDPPAPASGAPAGSRHTPGPPGPGRPAASAHDRRLAWRPRRDSAGRTAIPCRAPPGGFPLHTRCIEAWASHPVVLRPDPCVTMWDVMPCRGCWRCPAHVARAAGRRSASPSRRRGAVAVVVARPCGGRPASLPAGPPGAPRPWGVLTDRGGEARLPED